VIRALLLLLAAALAAGSPAPSAAAVEPVPPVLPVIEVPSSAKADTLMVFYSGDGGWAAIDRAVSAGVARQGVPVLGVDALRYFLTARTPQGAAADLAAAIDRYSRTWGARSIVLAGFSFGADALPLIVPELPAAVRARVRLVILVSPDRTGELAFHPGDWLNLSSKTSVPLGPALQRMKAIPTLCLHGTDDRDTGCPGFAGVVDRVVALPGGHHYAGYDGLVREMVAAIKAAAKPD